ncbi:MAG: 50S ribosomal protein L29 [Gammaproteobacteria bacterium]|jgi:large subunit ribosomal protein L29|nr:50S ribosomal protein L29 [Gammaproteobacteria bacterium]|tara:strand:+ start:185 stop:385 length:201 start_codon:yes stop_codon:yes gene_type:complete
MAKNKTKDYKNMKQEDLKKELMANRKSLFENGFKHKMGQLKESHLLKETRKNIARIKTELSGKDGS